MASNEKEVKCCREEPSQFDVNPQSNSFFQSSNDTINIIEQDSIEVVLSMEGYAKNFVESGRPKSAQNSTSNDWHISAEKERRVFRELEPSELDKDEGEAIHKGIHTWITELKALPNITNKKTYEYLLSDKTDDTLSKGAVKHKIKYVKRGQSKAKCQC